MLKNEVENIDLIQIKNELLPKITQIYTDVGAKELDNTALDIKYPVVEYPSKISSLNFDKTPKISGVLNGIKGQYLILDSGVLNIRKFSSYNIDLTY